MNKKGVFLSFEGPEAAAKSTQIKILEKFLIKRNIPYLITREPGGTKISEKLRKLILDSKYNISNNEELLLLMAARINHINNIIIPSLKKGKLVISDRFCDSTFVYQCYVNKFGIKKGQYLHKILLNNFIPFRTFLFLLPVKEIIKRLSKRKNKNKYDQNNIIFHTKVINGYKIISKNNKRFIIIDANRERNVIQKEIQSRVMKILNRYANK